jgi:DNA-binding response OmpR family regulator
MCRILVADDDQAMIDMVEQVLDHEGYDVVSVTDGQAVLDFVENDKAPIDLFILDLALPTVDGLEVCRSLRDNPKTAELPIVFLTGQRDTGSVSQALAAGGDDYIRKPFAVRELTARLRAHLRRLEVTNGEEISQLRIAPKTYQVFVDAREVMLTRIEFDLLRFMCLKPEEWHSTQDLLIGVWNYPEGVGDTALVRNHIRNLRRKLENNPDYPEIIQSRHGRGYSIKAHVQLSD